jgi:hypothetical protein
MGRKKVLEDELNDLEGKLQRAEKLVTGRAAVVCATSLCSVLCSRASAVA